MKKLQFLFVCIAIISFTKLSQAQTNSINQIEAEEEDGDGETRNMQTSCGGTELWSLKVLTDPAATTVNYTPVASTVAALVALTTPTPSTTMPRTGPVEKTTYIITCNITIKKTESDNDYHLVLSDGTHTLIGEIPDPNCTAALTSAHKSQFAAAKAFIDAHIASGNVMNVNIGQVTITGVGFVDPPHGQTGAAPNNLELHPILDIHFASANVPPTAAFTESATTVCVGQSVTLSDNSTNGPISWNWTMTGGTPSSSTSQNPSVTYSTAGTHTISLIAHNSAGASTPVSHTIIVNANPSVPTISLSGNTFTSSSSTGNQWYFNGVLISGATSQTYTAMSSGAYTVLVTNSSGCSNSSSATNITVSNPPVANFIVAAKICVGQAVALTDNSTNSPTSWNWTMGNGTPPSSTLQNPSVIYNTAGTYTITLISSNSYGASSPVSQTVTVNPAPPTPTITQNGIVLTSSLASGDQWYLNGILITGDTLPADSASQSGLYKVIATNQYGCSAVSAPLNITTTGINSIGQNDDLTIFPNPSNGIVTLRFAGKSEHYIIEVINDLGQLVYTEKINDCQNDCNEIIDMNSFKKGIYLFRIVSDGNIYTKKLLLIK